MKTPLVRTLLATALSLGALAFAPLAHAQIGWAVTTENQLISFGLSAPATALTTRTITGLRQSNGVSADPFGQILDLAQRGNQLYALDANANFYSLNAATGAATFLSSSLSPVGFDGGLAYDSWVGQFRFVSDAGENKLISPTGSVTSGAALFYGAGDTSFGTTASFSGVAIDYDFGTGFALNAANNTLATTVDANFSEFFTVGSLGLDITALASLDILADGQLYAALSTDSTTSAFYRIDSATGALSLVGNFGTGITALALTAANTPTTAVPEPSTYGALAGAATLALVVLCRRQRRG